MHSSLSRTVVILAALFAPAAAHADEWVPFAIPWDDAKSGVATDVSYLNNKSLPRLVVRNGQIVEQDSGKRVRFWAINFTFGNNFPDHDSADKVAAHLAKYGVNLVRLHHFDSAMAIPRGESIWDRTKNKKEIDPERLDRLQYLIAALARNGIYVDLNLKVSKELNKVDGAALDAKDTDKNFTTSFQKKIDRFDRFLIEKQKEYARQILLAPNPHRNNLTAAEDPAVALVEINNENAAAGFPGESPGADLRDLPAPYLTELKTLWTRYLQSKYGTQKNLLAEWKKNLTALGQEDILASLKTPWNSNLPGGGAAMTAEAQAPSGSSVFHVTKATGTDWHAQAIVFPPALKTGEWYTLEFMASSSTPRSMRVSIDGGGPNYESQGLSATIQITTKPTPYRLSFRAGAAENKRLLLNLGKAASDVTVFKMTLRTGNASGEDISMPDSIDTGLVALPADGALPNTQRDWQLFLANLDTTFSNQMRTYLRQDLDVKALLIDTQMSFGGTSSFAREKGSDIADSHAYWNHPLFGSGKWDPAKWTVEQKSLVLDALCKGNFGTLTELVQDRIAGKPFTVSEYDHPSPNDSVCEEYAVISSFACLQDWDAIFPFTYGEYGPQFKTDQILAFFDNAANPAKWAFTPAAALIFRNRLVEPLASVATLNIPDDVHGKYWNMSAPWDAVGGLPNPLQYRIETKPGAADVKLTRSQGTSSSKVTVADDRYEVIAPKAFICAGKIGGSSLLAGPMTLKLDSFDNNFASVMLVPLDNQPLAQSKHILLTIAGKAENQNMGWNAQRTSVGTRWGNGPIRIQRITGSLTGVPGLTIYPLAPDGTRRAASGSLTGDTVWYELSAEKGSM